ncbi:unnamed protein product [Cyprideis torosa]|uniref:Uncharacterized protein n=1 Tax=Cyprideis torosa TaxID=163714 RepID=A0A7R8ZVG7_9CRUS|nr:unnamed protein product [Cyprideis torosa]CAG0903176.1 unnamed protein product [Cyprideis torosa]
MLAANSCTERRNEMELRSIDGRSLSARNQISYELWTCRRTTSLMEISGKPSKSRNSLSKSPSPPSTGFLSVTDAENAVIDRYSINMAG